MKNYNEKIKRTIDPKRLYTTVKEVSSYHRIQASTGFRQAANYCHNKLKDLGIESKIISYDANPDIWYMQNKMFMEWDLKDAWLKVEAPELLLADAQAEPISIIQKSYPYDFTDGVELVYLDKGNKKDAYDDIDLKGKIIFVRDAFNGYMDWAIKERGAIGIVTDFMRTVKGVRDRNTLYESLNYTSFWWTHAEDEPKCFGFVLSPKMGDQLAEICKIQKELYEMKEVTSPYLCVKGKVETSLYPGAIEVVEATLPGESKEEVMISAHLCHPKSSCNDNASGVASAIEALRVLKNLIDNNEIPKNKRTIKIILIPEITGTYAYLSKKDTFKQIVGAINMDMVGGKQTRFYGPITLSALPYSTPSFIGDLSALCMDYAAKEVENIGDNMVAKTNHVVDLYTSGSDHIIFSDPTIGIPCCMVGQWPDLNYHTATDTLDVIDPEVLAFSTNIATLFAYTLANLSMIDVKEIQNKAHVMLAKRISDVIEAYNDERVDLKQAGKVLSHIESYYMASLYDYNRVLDMDDAFMEKEKEWIVDTINHAKEYLDVKDYPFENVDARVFVRDYVGPIDKLSNCVALHPEAKPYLEAYEKARGAGMVAHTLESLVQFYINGYNSVSAIIEKAYCDTLKDQSAYVNAFIDLLEALKLIHQK